MDEYPHYQDPKYAEQIMQESLMIGQEGGSAATSAGVEDTERKGPGSETGEPPAAEANQI